MDIAKYLRLKKALEENLGPESLNKMTEEISAILRKHNLDATPVILNDYLLYLKDTVRLSRI